MNYEVRPLRIYPHDITEAQLQTILDAKAAMDVDFKILPSPAAPGGPGRVLALGEIPPFFCESVVVTSGTPEGIARATEFALTAPAGAAGSFTEEAWLSAAFGCEVKFIGKESV